MANRTSTYTQVSTSSDDRPNSAEKKDLWSSMLDGVANGKRLPEKNILVLGMRLELWSRALANLWIGGTTDSQREFLEALSVDHSRKTQDRQSSKQPPVANNFALGYTYHDVLDADHEGACQSESRFGGKRADMDRYSCPTFSIPPRRPITVLHTSITTTPDSPNDPKHPHCGAS